MTFMEYAKAHKEEVMEMHDFIREELFEVDVLDFICPDDTPLEENTTCTMGVTCVECWSREVPK